MSGNTGNPDMSMEDLRVEIDDAPRSSPREFVLYLLKAARLAAFGDDSRLRQWPELASQESIDVLAAIRSVALEEEEALFKGNAEAIARAEDAHCLFLLEPRTTCLLGEISDALKTWIHSAEQAVPDSEATELLCLRRDSVPLGYAFRLGIVAVPLQEDELYLCAGLPRVAPRRISRKTEDALLSEQEMAMLDDGHPSERMISRFQSRAGEVALDGSGKILQAQPQLDHWWGLRVILDGDAAEEAESVRLGTLSLERHPEDLGVFQASLGNVNLATRLRLLGLDICIAMRDGGRLLL